jgi:hypothetical protein
MPEKWGIISNLPVLTPSRLREFTESQNFSGTLRIFPDCLSPTATGKVWVASRTTLVVYFSVIMLASLEFTRSSGAYPG